MRGVSFVSALLVAALCLGAAQAGAVLIGSTPKAAALAATKKFADHEIVVINRAGVSYRLGTCRLLHRKPWTAYGCGFVLHGDPEYCHGFVTVGVTRLADRKYQARAVKSKYLDDHGC